MIHVSGMMRRIVMMDQGKDKGEDPNTCAGEEDMMHSLLHYQRIPAQEKRRDLCFFICGGGTVSLLSSIVIA